MTDEEREELIVSGILALFAMLPELIAIIKASNSENKEEWLARIKKAQEGWQPWV